MSATMEATTSPKRMSVMSSDLLLAGKSKLKKLDESAQKKGERNRTHDITENDVEKYQQSVVEANIEEWGELLSSVTFKTKYLPLTVEEATAFLCVTDSHNKAERRPLPENDDNTKGAALTPPVDKMHAHALATLDSVEKRLQRLIDDDEDDWVKRGVFVKTSSRSAKDAAIAHQKLLAVYRSYLYAHFQPPYDFNGRIISLLHAGTQCLKCANAAEAMRMLKSSERIYQDMRLALDMHERNWAKVKKTEEEEGKEAGSNGSPRWTESLVVREWIDIDVSQEYRCFVKNRKVTAISQYNYVPYFQHLIDGRERYQRLILDFLNQTVLPLLSKSPSFADIIIDVAITEDAGNGTSTRPCEEERTEQKDEAPRTPKLWVIELNPFLFSTDGALFSWSKDVDLLTNSQGNFEFRLQERRSDGLRTEITRAWRDIVDDDNLLPGGKYLTETPPTEADHSQR